MQPGLKSRQAKTVILAGILLSIFCMVFGLTFGATASTKDSEEQEAPDEILIDNEVYKRDRKGSVYFTHTEHAESYVDECNACHHEYEDGKNIWEEGQPVQKCADCHDPQKRDGNIRKLNIAYHKNCKGCHRQLAREGGTEAPYRQCTDCHAKR